MTKEDALYIKLMTNSAAPVPEGWGRSSVGGKTIVTRPSSPAQQSVHPNNYASFEDDFDVNSYPVGKSTNALLTDNFEPDSGGWIDNYHVDDLVDQYKDMKERQKMSDSEIDEMLRLIEEDKGQKVSPEREAANEFLEYAIKYGRQRDR